MMVAILVEPGATAPAPAPAPPPLQRPAAMEPAPAPPPAEPTPGPPEPAGPLEPPPATVVPPGQAEPSPMPPTAAEPAPVPAPIEPVPGPPEPTAEEIEAGWDDALAEAPEISQGLDAVVAERLPKYRRRRNGMLGGAGVAMAFNAGLLLGGVADATSIRAYEVTVSSMPFAVAAVALGGFGGLFAGRAAAARDWLARSRERPMAGFIAGGALLTVAGGATMFSGWAMWGQRCLGIFEDCSRTEFRTGAGLVLGGSVSAAVGAVLLGYGASYRRARRTWAERAAEVSVLPGPGPSLAVSGRF